MHRPRIEVSKRGFNDRALTVDRVVRLRADRVPWREKIAVGPVELGQGRDVIDPEEPSYGHWPILASGQRGSGRQTMRHVSDQPVGIELAGSPARPAGWRLLTEGFPQSHVDLDDPSYLEFEYVRRLGHLVDLAAPASQPLRVLHLGGGALTLARYVAATRPESAQLAVE